MKSYNEFVRVATLMENPDYDVTRFGCLLEGKIEFDDELLTTSKWSSIVRFYESTNDYNRSKIADLINTNINNVNKVYKIVLDYDKVKQQQEN